jgi:hypothetical protein
MIDYTPEARWRMTEYTLEASVKLGMVEYALVASVDPCGSLLAEGIAECHYTGPQPVTVPINLRKEILKPDLNFMVLSMMISRTRNILTNCGRTPAW